MYFLEADDLMHTVRLALLKRLKGERVVRFIVIEGEVGGSITAEVDATYGKPRKRVTFVVSVVREATDLPE